jgi:hypothetical protein
MARENRTVIEESKRYLVFKHQASGYLSGNDFAEQTRSIAESWHVSQRTEQ